MRILIIDDDIKFSKQFKEDIEDFFNMYDNHVEIDMINFCFSHLSINKKYEIIFIDIELNKTNGISLTKKLKQKNPTSLFVFISAKNNLIHSSLTVQPFFFIRKNYYSQDLSIFFDLFKETITNNHMIQLSYKATKATIPLQDIIYIEATQHILNFYTQEHIYKDNHSLKDIINILPDKYFIQIHRSFIINSKYIYSFSRGNVNMYKTDTDEYTSLPISRSYQKHFENKYQEFLLI